MEMRWETGTAEFTDGGNLVMIPHPIQGGESGERREREEILLVTSCYRNCCMGYGSEAEVTFSLLW